MLVVIGTRIRDSRLRQDYSVTVLGIRRDKNYIKEELSDHRLQNGDTLLVQGKWKKIMQMNQENENWLVLGKPDKQMEKVSLDYKAPVAAAIMLLMIVVMVFDFIPISPVVAVAIAGLLMVFSGCFRNVDAAYKTINWESIVLIDVYQQHGNSGIDGTNSIFCSSADRSKSIFIYVCRYPWCQYVFCFAFLYSAKCSCDESRTIHLYGLCICRITTTNHIRYCDDIRTTIAIPLCLGE